MLDKLKALAMNKWLWLGLAAGAAALLAMNYC